VSITFELAKKLWYQSTPVRRLGQGGIHRQGSATPRRRPAEGLSPRIVGRGPRRDPALPSTGIPELLQVSPRLDEAPCFGLFSEISLWVRILTGELGFETYLSTQPAAPGEDARLSESHEDARRTQHSAPAPPEGSASPDALRVRWLTKVFPRLIGFCVEASFGEFTMGVSGGALRSARFFFSQTASRIRAWE
jgi:hypothetical protein